MARNVLISLVGDQAVPNVFLIRDQAFRQAGEYIFVTTPLMEERQRLQHILASTGIPAEKYRCLCVEADMLPDIRRKLDGLQLPKEGCHYYVNLTSGTKLMSIALYEYFTQPAYRHCSSIFYIPIGRNAYLQVYPEARRKATELSYRISLTEYLTSYGIHILEGKGAEQLACPLPYTQQVFHAFLNAIGHNRRFVPMMKELRNTYNRNQQRAELDIRPGPELQAFLQQLDFPLSPGGRLDKARTEYLIGGWLEEWAFGQLQHQYQLPPAAIAQGVKVSRTNAHGEAVTNECDVLFTYNNTLYLVECKAGLGRNPKKLFEDAVYKLNTLRMEFGQRVEALLFTLSNLSDKQGRLKKDYRNRAALHGIELYDRSRLEELAGSWLIG